MYSSSRANTGCTAADWAKALSGDRRTLIASAVLVLVDKNFRRERFIKVSPAKAQSLKRRRVPGFLRLCAFAREIFIAS
jgi:hypothetical protein